MKLQEFLTEITKIQMEYNRFMNGIDKKCAQFNGMSVRISRGKYKGRWGKVKYTQVTDAGVIALIYPYRLKGKGDECLSDHVAARTFWNLANITEIKEKKQL